MRLIIKRTLLILIITMLLLPVQAQDIPPLRETFESAEYEYAFDYPSHWIPVPSEDDSENRQTFIAAGDVAVDIQYFVVEETARQVMSLLIENLEGESTVSTITTVTLDYGEALRVEVTDDREERLLMFFLDMEDKVFMIRGLSLPDDEVFEPTLIAMMNSIRLIPAEIDLPLLFEDETIPFTFQYPDRWRVSARYEDRRSLGIVQLITSGRESVIIQVYPGISLEGAYLLADVQSERLKLTQQRSTSLMLNSYRGFFLVYAAPFFQQRLVYLLEIEEHIVHIEIIVGITDSASSYQRILKAMLLTVTPKT